MIAIQRAVQKFFIAVFLTREFKHDETNRAWWKGKWYGRGMGNSAISQPAREFIVKIVEMTLWGSDFLLAHIILVVLTPAILVPYANTLHSMMLCMLLFLPFVGADADISPVWLRPSKQIRPPLFSTKQKRQRRWIVIKYTFVYIIMVALLASLIVLRTSSVVAVWPILNVSRSYSVQRSHQIRL